MTDPAAYRRRSCRSAASSESRRRRHKARLETDPAYRARNRAKYAKKYSRLTAEQKRLRRLRAEARLRERDPAAFRLRKKLKRARTRHRRRLATGTFTPRDIKQLFKVQRGRCAYFRTCGTMLADNYHIDHIMPICLGGTNDPANLQLTCPGCNRSKGGKDPKDFARELGLLV